MNTYNVRYRVVHEIEREIVAESYEDIPKHYSTTCYECGGYDAELVDAEAIGEYIPPVKDPNDPIEKIIDPGAWGHEGTIQLIKDGIEVEMNGDSLREFRDAIKASQSCKCSESKWQCRVDWKQAPGLAEVMQCWCKCHIGE